MALADRAVSLAVVVLLAGCAGNGDDSTQMSRAEAPANPAAASAAQSCFAPLPGHPTPAEQRTFVQEVGQLAVAAERTYGVPAAALTAMAIQESGYGWTSLAQQTNNILAWKSTTLPPPADAVHGSLTAVGLQTATLSSLIARRRSTLSQSNLRPPRTMPVQRLATARSAPKASLRSRQSRRGSMT
jgi:hypothetical protein